MIGKSNLKQESRRPPLWANNTICKVSGVAFNREYAFKQIESQTKDVFSQEMPRTPVWAEFQSVAVECLDRFPAQIVASPSYILFSDCSQCWEEPYMPTIPQLCKHSISWYSKPTYYSQFHNSYWGSCRVSSLKPFDHLVFATCATTTTLCVSSSLGSSGSSSQWIQFCLQ